MNLKCFFVFCLASFGDILSVKRVASGALGDAKSSDIVGHSEGLSGGIEYLTTDQSIEIYSSLSERRPAMLRNQKSGDETTVEATTDGGTGKTNDDTATTDDSTITTEEMTTETPVERELFAIFIFRALSAIIPFKLTKISPNADSLTAVKSRRRSFFSETTVTSPKKNRGFQQIRQIASLLRTQNIFYAHLPLQIAHFGC
jgi:hypothetical protein